jgi:hypothetical protein
MNWLFGGAKAVEAVIKPTFDDKRFFDVIRPFFGGLNQEQVDGINGIIKAFREVGDGDIDTLAYALATAYHETGKKMVPVREGFAKTDKGARSAVAKLAVKRGPSSAPAKYGQPAGPYGHVYYGRGHVQLTWLHNYRNSSKDAGVDLEKYPDKMLDPVISARVLIRGIMDGRWNGEAGFRKRKDWLGRFRRGLWKGCGRCLGRKRKSLGRSGWKSCRWGRGERENWIDGGTRTRYYEVTCSNTLNSYLKGEVEMYGRSIWLADEIACMFVDDFLNLPAHQVLGYVWEPTKGAEQRHRDCWDFTH